MEKIASLFVNGGSQAVRLPREFRFEGSAVRVYREGNRVILEPIEKPQWPASFFEQLSEAPLSSDFDVGPPLPPSQYREDAIDRLSEE